MIKVSQFLMGLIFLSAVTQAIATDSVGTPIEHVTAPGGKTVYYIVTAPGEDDNGQQNVAIEAGLNENSYFEILLSPHPDSPPQNNLTGFSNLELTPDAKSLYFLATAWGTSEAIHSIDIATKKVSFVTDGNFYCIVRAGEYQGDLIVEQHRYFIQGGSYDDFFLYSPLGKELGLVAKEKDNDDISDIKKLCQMLGN